MKKDTENKIVLNIKNWLGFGDGHERSKRAKKNIFASAVIKGLNIAIGIALVPMILKYLGTIKYGIWITLSSLIGWFGFFDIGLGRGLQNRFAKALANGKHHLARTYVSTTYAILAIIITGILVLFFTINPFLDWSGILNAGKNIISKRELNRVVFIVFTFFCFRFVTKLIAIILKADQRPAKASLFDLLGKILSLVLIFILIHNTEGNSLFYLGFIISGAPVLVLIISSIWFYRGKYKAYKPSFGYIDFSKASDLLNMGVKFFVIQISVIVLYQSDTIIIAHLFGPEEVTTYNIVFKYFSILTMGFTIILTPFWSAFTEAWVKNEVAWIKNIMRKLYILWGCVCLGGIIMFVCSKWIFNIWIGDKVIIPYTVSILMAIWVLMNAWNGIFSKFLNGVGKIKLQLYCGIFSAILNVPLSIFLGLKIGIEGVLLSNILVGITGSYIYPFQYKKLINKKAKDIWNE